MMALIASGDEDNTNFRELSGLYMFTGQHAKSVEYHRLAMERTEEQDSVLYLNMELVMHLFEAGQEDEARALVDTIMNEYLPAQREALGMATIQVGMQMAGMILDHDPVLAASILDTEVSTPAQNVGGQLVSLVERGVPDEMWTMHPQVSMFRRLLRQYASLGLAIAEGIGPEALANGGNDEHVSQVLNITTSYLNKLALADADNIDDRMGQYAMLGQMLVASQDNGLETVLDRLDQASVPNNANGQDDRQRVLAQNNEQQLSGWKISVPFYTQQLMHLVEDTEHTPDPVIVDRLRRGLEAAVIANKKLGVDGARGDQMAHLGLTIAAVLGNDEELLRERLQIVRERNDKRLRDSTAQWLGDAAPHTTKERLGYGPGCVEGRGRLQA